ncbi:MAG: ParB/RepB/Spo0J family partition protein [Neisseriaceae bacterium]
MGKRNTLGRGLEALLSTELDSEHHGSVVELIDLNFLCPGIYQPRTVVNEEELKDLAQSIRAHGVIQPILVRPKSATQYEVVVGERRWRASQLLGLSQIPAIIKSINNENALALGLIENIQRQALNPIEEARGLQRLKNEFGLTHEKIANAVGRSRSNVTNTMRLLQLPTEIQDFLVREELTVGHVRALSTLPKEIQLKLANKAIKGGWSVRELEERARLTGLPKQRQIKSPKSRSLEEQLSQYFGVKVTFKQKKDQEAGILSFSFASSEQLTALLGKFQLPFQE